jgi:hypothetical protein
VTAGRRSRERTRLLTLAKRAHGRRAGLLCEQARTLDRLAELDRELKAAADGTDALADGAPTLEIEPGGRP